MINGEKSQSNDSATLAHLAKHSEIIQLDPEVGKDCKIVYLFYEFLPDLPKLGNIEDLDENQEKILAEEPLENLNEDEN